VVQPAVDRRQVAPVDAAALCGAQGAAGANGAGAGVSAGDHLVGWRLGGSGQVLAFRGVHRLAVQRQSCEGHGGDQ